MQEHHKHADFGTYVQKHLGPMMQGKVDHKVVLLSCMDSRYPHRIVDTMDANGLRGQYFHLILAGGSLGILKVPGAMDVLVEQIRLVHLGHEISELLILEHRDCAAYRAYLEIGPDDPQAELEAHTKTFLKAAKAIVKRIPRLKGKVEGRLLPIEAEDILGNI